jgi:carboxymethylenebutenolidase
MHELRTGQAPKLAGLSIDLAGGKAYLSLPPGAGPPLPGVVVIQEWWGLNDNIRHWADRLAAEGYAALAVDLYDGKLATTSDSAMAYMRAVRPERAREILLAAHAFLAEDPRILARHRGSIGWCYGGHQSLQLAMAAPDLDACVMYYGNPVSEVEALKAVKAPLLGIFAAQDEFIPPATVQAFGDALTKAGVDYTIKSFAGVHAFANPSNPRYEEESAAAAWDETRRFLAQHLKPER